ncbi:single-stranded DNA-binding protein [Lactobacillus johnsonii]|uniref:single-stranded DNA-binding protein n=1 Tax=Lactobacillus johnsonii TaxID=33959 RepID=UPI0021A4B14D|nr:single-stranded DNA-binding protein [Lactobacillus johnsonii]MCT3322428.1 single-stranded DNA-binding protein [Lactobacillus johnsonii]
MNDIKLLGRLAQKPEVKKSQAGHQYAWFTVAVPRKNDKDQADFIRCVAFGKLAAAMEKYCSKGRQVLVQGRLQVSHSTDQKTQETRYHHTVVAHAANFLHDPTLSAASAEAPF